MFKLSVTSPSATFDLASSVASVNEGAAFNVSLTTTGVQLGQAVPYTITGIQAADLVAGSLTGSFVINNDSDVKTFTVAEDALVEGAEVFTLTLDDHNTVSKAVTINDTTIQGTTWNPAHAQSGVTLSNGNLTITDTTGASFRVLSLAGHNTGKWYWEVTMTLASQGDMWVGVAPAGTTATNPLVDAIPGFQWRSEGQLVNNQVWSFPGGAWNYEYANNLTLMFALDTTTGKLWVGKSGTWFGSNPSTGTGQTTTIPTSYTWHAGVFTDWRTGTNTVVANFGQHAFVYPVPAGFSPSF